MVLTSKGKKVAVDTDTSAAAQKSKQLGVGAAPLPSTASAAGGGGGSGGVPASPKTVLPPLPQLSGGGVIAPGSQGKAIQNVQPPPLPSTASIPKHIAPGSQGGSSPRTIIQTTASMPDTTFIEKATSRGIDIRMMLDGSAFWLYTAPSKRVCSGDRNRIPSAHDFILNWC